MNLKTEGLGGRARVLGRVRDVGRRRPLLDVGPGDALDSFQEVLLGRDSCRATGVSTCVSNFSSSF